MGIAGRYRILRGFPWSEMPMGAKQVIVGDIPG